MVPVSVAAIVNYFEKHALCSCSLSLSFSFAYHYASLPYCLPRYLSRTRAPYQLPHLASSRLASPRRCFFVLCELVLWFGPLERNGDASSIHARIYARRTFALSMLSQSRECNTRYARLCIYTCVRVHVHGHRYRCGNASRRRREEAANFD